MALKITLDSGQTMMVGDVAVKNTSKPNKKNGGHGGKAAVLASPDARGMQDIK